MRSHEFSIYGLSGIIAVKTVSLFLCLLNIY